ncbi:DUF1998 domain-containing protein, partial [Butyricicoccus sp. 1XD8-22]
LSEKVYDILDAIFEESISHVEGCPCENGCPSCIGAQDSLQNGKEKVLKILSLLLNEMK